MNTLTRRELEHMARVAEREQPTRARAVVAYLNAAERPIGLNRQERRRRSHKRSATKEKERRRRYFEPDPKEREIRELNRLMRSELERAPEEDGEIAGPLSVVAKYATPQLLKDFDLDESHTAPFEHWLKAKFGDVLRYPDVAGYLEWRESCRKVEEKS